MNGDAASQNAWRKGDGGLVVTVRLTPKGGRDAIEGVGLLADGRRVLKARVRAAAQDGEANAALIRLLARALGLPLAAVQLKSGATARLKTLALAGDADALGGALGAMTGARPRQSGAG